MTRPVLIIEDDADIAESLRYNLEREGLKALVAETGEKGLSAALDAKNPPALIILDLMLPGLSGFEVLRRLRAQSDVPVLMLTACGEDVDRIVGLEIGADDYLPKPCNPRELVARIRAILRRSKPSAQTVLPAAPEPKSICVGDVELDLGTRVVRRAGETVELTGAEFDLLTMMLRNAGQVISREELVRSVLDRPLTPFDRSIDTLVSNLRRKLGHYVGGVERIKSVRGSGYVYARSDEPQSHADATHTLGNTRGRR